jgi:hypothetical protein
VTGVSCRTADADDEQSPAAFPDCGQRFGQTVDRRGIEATHDVDRFVEKLRAE